MTRMNYSRPNGGYEKEPWDKKYDAIKKPKPKSNSYIQHHTHNAKVLVGKYPHAGRLYCTDCKVTIQWLSKEETEIAKKIGIIS